MTTSLLRNVLNSVVGTSDLASGTGVARLRDDGSWVLDIARTHLDEPFAELGLELSDDGVVERLTPNKLASICNFPSNVVIVSVNGVPVTSRKEIEALTAEKLVVSFMCLDASAIDELITMYIHAEGSLDFEELLSTTPRFAFLSLLHPLHIIWERHYAKAKAAKAALATARALLLSSTTRCEESTNHASGEQHAQREQDGTGSKGNNFDDALKLLAELEDGKEPTPTATGVPVGDAAPNDVQPATSEVAQSVGKEAERTKKETASLFEEDVAAQTSKAEETSPQHGALALEETVQVAKAEVPVEVLQRSDTTATEVRPEVAVSFVVGGVVVRRLGGSKPLPPQCPPPSKALPPPLVKETSQKVSEAPSNATPTPSNRLPPTPDDKGKRNVPQLQQDRGTRRGDGAAPAADALAPICRDFQRGNCRRRDCVFRHEDGRKEREEPRERSVGKHKRRDNSSRSRDHSRRRSRSRNRNRSRSRSQSKKRHRDEPKWSSSGGRRYGGA